MNSQGCQISGKSVWFSDALKYIGRSAMDLHRYRYIRTRMLHDSLNRVDRDRRADLVRSK
jgi:hypothetical protein